MVHPLPIPELEKLVAERALELDWNVTRDRVRVYEDSGSGDGPTLIIQIAARRPLDRKVWTRSRMRFSQAIRDMLVQRGDDRYPLLQVFEPEEWVAQDA